LPDEVTPREEFEILRGEPIRVFVGDPMCIPCVETSDPERLCAKPVVSVSMLAYNHEPYIRQAIEGVMMQKTDFEFELVIGEDCSTDGTREICLEYQKRYPDRIRVLWCDRNLFREPHPAGGNGERNAAHCRGEFIALCEGDDYWIDPLKLQKQVDILRRNPNVGFCFCGSKTYRQAENKYEVWNEGFSTYQPGLQRGRDFFVSFLLGSPPGSPNRSEWCFIMTATTMIRSSLLREMKKKYEIFAWALRLGDATLWLGASSLMDGYYLPDVVSVYRITGNGLFQNPATRLGVEVDGVIVRMFFFQSVLGLPLTDYPKDAVYWMFLTAMSGWQTAGRRARYAWGMLRLRGVALHAALRWYLLPFWLCAAFGLDNRFTRAATLRFACHAGLRRPWGKSILSLYGRKRPPSRQNMV